VPAWGGGGGGGALSNEGFNTMVLYRKVTFYYFEYVSL
jgi:hypothetical protein